MMMPGFTAEAALYKTNEHYQLAASGGQGLEGDVTVSPQACPWWEWPICATKISACTTICSTAGSFAWLPCMANCLFLIGAAPCLRCVT